MKECNVLEFIPKGKENAISRYELADLLGCNDRDMRLALKKACLENEVLVVASNQGGYYIPEADAEIENFIRIEKARALSILKNVNLAKKMLKKDKNQLSFNDVL